MNRRDMIALAALGLVGCATAKAPVATAPVPKKECIVCHEALAQWNWYGEEGPYCQKHLEERMARDRPKKGLVGTLEKYRCGDNKHLACWRTRSDNEGARG